jgi:MoxR-like ATPase
MSYQRKYFDPESTRGAARLDDGSVAVRWRLDKEDDDIEQKEDVYVLSPKVILAVNVALATERPLLIAGEPGSGKSRLAGAVAHVLGRQMYRYTVTSRTQAADLLWTYDALQRLNDAATQGQKLKPYQAYVRPGMLWWGFHPKSAVTRGTQPLPAGASRADDPAAKAAKKDAAVVLVDEIDKADPDVPNDLLEPFDVKRFTVKETGDVIEAKRDVLLMLTTNGERELPPAFVRRCVLLVLDDPDPSWFEKVAARHFPKGSSQTHKRMAAEVMRLRRVAARDKQRKPSTAEFLDALKVSENLRIEVDATSKVWTDVVNSVLLKVEKAQQPAAAAPSSSQPAGASNAPA